MAVMSVETLANGPRADAESGGGGSGSGSYLPRIDQFYIPEWLTMQFVLNNMICFTPLISYGTTVLSIRKSKTALGFSIDICATMLLASILRISYYLITPYDIILLRQSLVMIFIQLILLRTSLHYRPEEYKYENLKPVDPFTQLFHDVWLEYFPLNPFGSDWKHLIKSLSFKGFLQFVYKLCLVVVYKFLKFFDPSYRRYGSFWQWNRDANFWMFLLYFSTAQLTLTLFVAKLMHWTSLAQSIGSAIGSLGLFIESLLPLPQISILNKLKSVQGFKLILLVSWLCGDIVKIGYLVFGANNISSLFLFFALFQMSLDFYIAGQYVYYRFYSPSIENGNASCEEIELTTINSLQSKPKISSNH
ncbi:LAME_0F07734g1_1 [Lachancea meyersii CBS 8951]|uniref:LAME_0F07734g1_1 n=1 Tax=Lachancea meyersii CBS 8951 TaxID=1266667 RepID=A0A1G4JUI1_9SACH|nr:LAME_0F07734g1_1 [Lachancea meyersii CBS 8951]